MFNGGQGWSFAEVGDAAADTVAFIKANKDKPFYVNVWLHESHTPHVPTTESMEKWKHLDKQKQVYAAVITDGDNAVGKILDALKAEGLADNTIVMFSSDNGPESTAAKDGPKLTDPDAERTATTPTTASAKRADSAAASAACSKAAYESRSSSAGPITPRQTRRIPPPCSRPWTCCRRCARRRG